MILRNKIYSNEKPTKTFRLSKHGATDTKYSPWIALEIFSYILLSLTYILMKKKKLFSTIRYIVEALFFDSFMSSAVFQSDCYVRKMFIWQQDLNKENKLSLSVIIGGLQERGLGDRHFRRPELQEQRAEYPSRAHWACYTVDNFLTNST